MGAYNRPTVPPRVWMVNERDIISFSSLPQVLSLLIPDIAGKKRGPWGLYPSPDDIDWEEFGAKEADIKDEIFRVENRIRYLNNHSIPPSTSIDLLLEIYPEVPVKDVYVFIYDAPPEGAEGVLNRWARAERIKL